MIQFLFDFMVLPEAKKAKKNPALEHRVRKRTDG
jgi:hypothetical protein